MYSKIHQNLIIQRFIARISFSTVIVDMDPMKRISLQVLTFLTIYAISEYSIFGQNCLKFNGSVVSFE